MAGSSEPVTRSPSNEMLVREGAQLVERVGRPLADSAAAARVLDLPERESI